MCIAILVLAGQRLTRAEMWESSKNNPHGMGLAFVANKKVHVLKSLIFEEFYTKYNELVDQNPTSNFMVHFRYNTKGFVSLQNCHPFAIDSCSAMMHNGHIKAVTPGEGESDSFALNRDILQQLPKKWQENGAICELIDEYIGESKVVVLNSDNSYSFFNEKLGAAHWNKDKTIWYSNWSYFPNTRSRQIEKPTVWQQKGEEPYYNYENNIGWTCSRCHKYYLSHVIRCTCGVYKPGRKPAALLPFVSGSNILAKTCSFCGDKDCDINFVGTVMSKAVRLCKKCRDVLERNGQEFFPVELFKTEKGEIKR